MSNIITSGIIERVVKELLEVLKRQRERYMYHIKNSKYLSEDELENILKELSKIERSIDRILHGFPVVNALIGSWFYAVLVEAESLIKELYVKIKYDEESLRNGKRR
jgi:hypothetical protein